MIDIAACPSALPGIPGLRIAGHIEPANAARVRAVLGFAVAQSDDNDAVACAVALVFPNGAVGTIFDGGNKLIPLLGAVDLLHGRMLQAVET